MANGAFWHRLLWAVNYSQWNSGASVRQDLLTLTGHCNFEEIEFWFLSSLSIHSRCLRIMGYFTFCHPWKNVMWNSFFLCISVSSVPFSLPSNFTIFLPRIPFQRFIKPGPWSRKHSFTSPNAPFSL